MDSTAITVRFYQFHVKTLTQAVCFILAAKGDGSLLCAVKDMTMGPGAWSSAGGRSEGNMYLHLFYCNVII